MASFRIDNMLEIEKNKRNDKELKEAMETLDPLNALYGKFEKEEAKKALNTVEGFTVAELPVENLIKSSMNCFSELTGSAWEEFVASIKAHGVLNPITVRKATGDKYEILAGHNRVRAAREVGLEKVVAIVKDVDDVDASFIIADTNLQREYVSDLEKGWAYRNIYEAIARQGQGKRNDLIKKEPFGHADQEVKNSNAEPFGHADQKVKKKHSSEIIAEKYGIGEKTVRRKIRLTYLIPPMYAVYEREKSFTQEIAEHFSYLRKSEQAILTEMINQGEVFTVENAKILRNASEERETPLSDVDMVNLLNLRDDIFEEKEKKVRPAKYKVDDTLFPTSLKKNMREDYILKALLYIKENDIDLNEYLEG